MQKKSAWVTWEKQPRNKSMALLFDADYHEIIFKKSKIKRYSLSIIHTLKIFKQKYSTIFVQNPSIILSFVAAVYALFSQKKFVIDAHNAGVYPLEGRHKLLQAFNLWILKRVDLVIVTNTMLSKYLEAHSIKYAICPDPLPQYSEEYYQLQRQDRVVLVVCSWAEDEPIEDYLAAAKNLPEIEFKFTGNFRKSTFLKNNKNSENVTLLGFVSEHEYIASMFQASVMLDLTTRKDCLVCGAYESISSNTPVILSDTVVNQEVFGSIAHYTQNNHAAIVEAIIRVFSSSDSPDFEFFKTQYKNGLESYKHKVWSMIDH